MKEKLTVTINIFWHPTETYYESTTKNSSGWNRVVPCFRDPGNLYQRSYPLGHGDRCVNLATSCDEFKLVNISKYIQPVLIVQIRCCSTSVTSIEHKTMIATYTRCEWATVVIKRWTYMYVMKVVHEYHCVNLRALLYGFLR